MKKLIALSVLVLSATAGAQDIGLYNRALSAFNAGNYDESTRAFFELAENSTDPDIRAKSEYYFAQSLARKGMPFAASYQYQVIIRRGGPSHPFYLKAVEGLVNAQRELDDQYVIPSFLNQELNDAWVTLPVEVLGRINFLIGSISQRQARFDEARDFLMAVPPETAIYAKAQYLLGVLYTDPRFPGGAQPNEALKIFNNILGLTNPHYEGLTETKHLAILGLGRVHYGLGEYQKATESYERIPRFTKYWDEALFENGFARFQNDDYGGALGSLQALHAPQFEGAFQPESWILKSTVYYFNCLYEESKTALDAFDKIYKPMEDKLRAMLEGDKEPEYFYAQVANESGTEVPRPVLLWVRGNERMLSLFGMLAQIDREIAAIKANTAWQGSRVGESVTETLESSRGLIRTTAGTVAKNRLMEAMTNIKTFSDTAEIIRFELSKAEKELLDTGFDQQAVLEAQNLYRPAMPAENWNYWRFQGEFWIDEIGYYQYTLKTGCPAAPAEDTGGAGE